MKKFKTYFLLLISTLVFFILSFCVSKEASFTLNIKDTYYVIPEPDFYIGSSILTFISGLIYFILDMANVKLISILSKIHIYTTLILIVALIFFNYKNNLDFKSVKFEDFMSQIDYNFYIIISLILVFSLQFFFLINIFVAQIKNLRNIAAK